MVILNSNASSKTCGRFYLCCIYSQKIILSLSNAFTNLTKSFVIWCIEVPYCNIIIPFTFTRTISILPFFNSNSLICQQGKRKFGTGVKQEHENSIHVHKKVLHAHISLSDYNIQSLTYKDYPLSIYDCSVIDTFFHNIKIILSQGIL